MGKYVCMGPEEDIGSPGTGVTTDYKLPDVGLRTELRSLHLAVELLPQTPELL